MRKRWQVLERRIKRYKKNSVTLSDSKKRSKPICSDSTVHKSATQKHIRVRPIAPFSAILHPQFASRVPPHHQFFGNNFPGMLPVPHSFHSMYPPSFTSGIPSFHIPQPVMNQRGTKSFATKRVSKLKPRKISRHSDTSINVEDIDFTCDESFDVVLHANDSDVGTTESFSRASNTFVDDDDFDNKSHPTKNKHAEKIPRIVVEEGKENVASVNVDEMLLLPKTNFVAPTVQEVQSGGKSHSISVRSLQKCLKAIDRVAGATKGGLSVYFNRNEVDEQDIEMEDIGNFNDDIHSQYSAENYGSISNPGRWKYEWGKYFEIFKNIYKEQGSCKSIDSTHPVLGSWVAYQRVQHQNLIAGKESTLTMNQVRLLRDIGFVFDTKKNRREMCSLNQQKISMPPKRANPLPQHLSHLPVAKRLCLDKYPQNLSNSQSTSRFVVVNDSGVKLAKLIQNEQLHSTDFVLYIVAQLDICSVSKINFGQQSTGPAFQTGDDNSRMRGLRCGHCKSRHFVYQNFQGLSRSFCRGIAQHLEVSK